MEGWVGQTVRPSEFGTRLQPAYALHLREAELHIDGVVAWHLDKPASVAESMRDHVLAPIRKEPKQDAERKGDEKGNEAELGWIAPPAELLATRNHASGTWDEFVEAAPDGARPAT